MLTMGEIWKRSLIFLFILGVFASIVEGKRRRVSSAEEMSPYGEPTDIYKYTVLKRGRAVGSWAEAGGQLLKIVYNLLNTAVFADGESAAAALEQLVEFVQQYGPEWAGNLMSDVLMLKGGFCPFVETALGGQAPNFS